MAEQAGLSEQTIAALRTAVITASVYVRSKDVGFVGATRPALADGWTCASSSASHLAAGALQSASAGGHHFPPSAEDVAQLAPIVPASWQPSPVVASQTSPPPRRIKPPSSRRQQLSMEQAAEIYQLRPMQTRRAGVFLHCRELAPYYGVTSITIRDVWTGRTWIEATQHLWTKEERAHRLARCKGRRRRSQSHISSPSTSGCLANLLNINDERDDCESDSQEAFGPTSTSASTTASDAALPTVAIAV